MALFCLCRYPIIFCLLSGSFQERHDAGAAGALLFALALCRLRNDVATNDIDVSASERLEGGQALVEGGDHGRIVAGGHGVLDRRTGRAEHLNEIPMLGRHILSHSDQILRRRVLVNDAKRGVP